MREHEDSLTVEVSKTCGPFLGKNNGLEAAAPVGLDVI